MTGEKHSFLPGLALLLGGALLWNALIEDIRRDFLLIRGKSVAPGTLTATHESETEDERGRVSFSDVGVYQFVTNDVTYKSATNKATGRLPSTVKVEFLTRDPSVNRVAGDGAQTMFEWAWRKLGLGVLLLIMFTAPGISLLSSTLKKCRLDKLMKESTPDPGR